MTPEQIDRVFGNGRLKMVTGEHVEVFREAVVTGERRRYTKRFLNTSEADFGQWTEREWRILARLIGHGIACVPEVVQFDRGRHSGTQIVQTYDAGVTVDQWATLLPVARDGRVYRHVFEDCAHWWALAHHCLLALDAIHPLELVHLDIKGDNVCIPYAPADFDPDSSNLRMQPMFAQLALIDFAFALISRESLTTPLPIGWQKDYDYQSPRLLAALEAGRNGDLQRTRELDWRCDMYSLAAMLQRYLPDTREWTRTEDWTREHRDGAMALLATLRDFHDNELPAQRPHANLIEATGAMLREREMALSLARGWTLARDVRVAPALTSLLTPVTCIAPVTRLATPIRALRSGRVTAITVAPPAPLRPPVPAPRRRRAVAPLATLAVAAAFAAAAALWYARAPLADLIAGIHAPTGALRAAADDVAPPLVQGAEKRPQNLGDVATSEETRLPAQRSPATAAPVPASPAEPRGVGEAAEVAARGAASPLSTHAAPVAPPALSTQSVARAPAASSAQVRATAPAVSPGSESRRMVAAAPPVLPAPPPAAQAGDAALENRSAFPPAISRKDTVTTRTAEKSPVSPDRRTHASWAALEPPAWLRSGKPPDPPGLGTAAVRSTPASATATAQAKSAATTNGRRPPASWASLEPPSWLRTGNPPPVPGVNAQEPEATALAQASAPAPQAATIATEPLQSISTAANAPSRESTPAASAVRRAPATAVPRAPVPGDANTAAPIEDRNPAAMIASAPSAGAAIANLSRPVVPLDVPAVDDFRAQGRRILNEHVPRLARLAEPDVARVLRTAAGASLADQDRSVAGVARVAWRRDDSYLLTRPTAPTEARRLSERARTARALRRLDEALDLQLQAFGANPRDAEIAAELASLYLDLSPPEPERARELALFALATRGAYLPSAWTGGWNALAAANAIGGRTADARNALFVTLAVSEDAEHACASALHAYANYGDRMRAPVEAMLYRAHTQGRDQMFPACAWPPPPPPQMIGRAGSP